MKKKHKSTYEEFIEDSKEHKLLDQEFQALLVSGLLLAAMEEELGSSLKPLGFRLRSFKNCVKEEGLTSRLRHCQEF